MKKKALILALFAGMVFATSCADDVLNVCTECEESTTGSTEEFCGGIVAVEAYEQTMESNNYVCIRK